MSARRLLVPVLIAGALLAAEDVAAGVLRVGPDAAEDFDTLQGAVDAARDGDILDIAPAEYVEQVAIVGKDLTLRSRHGFGLGPRGSAVIRPDRLLANGTTSTGRSVHAAIVVEQATVRIEFLHIRGDGLTTAQLNDADVPAGIAVLGPGAAVHVRNSRVSHISKRTDSTTTVDSPCGLAHQDYYSLGAGILAFDADALTAEWNSLFTSVPLAAVCTRQVDLRQNRASASIRFPDPAIQIVGDGAVARENQIFARDLGLLVTGDAGVFSRNYLRSPSIGFQLEGNGHLGSGNFLEGDGTPVVDLGSGNAVEFREHGSPPALGDPAP